MSGARAPGAELRIVKDLYVVLDYALYDGDGDLVEATDDEGGAPIGVVHGYGLMLPALERALVGMAAGETRDVTVESHDAYGPWNEDGERWVDRADFPDTVAVDDEFEAVGDDGEETTLRVVEVTEDAVLVDATHPLAGETLRFDVMIRTVRHASPAELAEVRAVAPKTGLRVVSGAEQAGSTRQSAARDRHSAPTEVVAQPPNAAALAKTRAPQRPRAPRVGDDDQ